MRKFALISILISVLFSFAACDESQISNVDSGSDLEKQRMQEALKALDSIGAYDRVLDVPKGFSFNENMDAGGKSLESGECMIDGIGLSYISLIVEFDGFCNSMEAYMDSIPVVEIDFDNDFDSTIYDSSKTYLIIRNYYFDGTITPAYRLVYVIDGESLVRGDFSKARETSFSPDFRFDINNQWDVIKDIPRRYDWISMEDCEADVYRLLPKSEDDVFSNLALNGKGSCILNAWQLYRDDEPVNYSKDEGAYYIVELSSFDKNTLSSFELASTKRLRIGSFVNENPNFESVYARVIQYPKNYRSCYSVMLYWFQSGRWNYTVWIATNEDFDFKYYVEVPLDDIESSIPGILNIGRPSIAYREFLNGQPLSTIWNSEIDGFYIVEFSEVRESLLTESKNSKGREVGRLKSTDAGKMHPGTVAVLYLFRERGAEDYSVCVMVKNGPDSFYSSYTYLAYDKEFNKVVSEWDYILLVDESKTRFEGLFPTVCDVWQKVGKDGAPKKYNDDDGGFFIVSMAEYKPSFNPDFLDCIECEDCQVVDIDGLEPASSNLVYAQITQFPKNYTYGYDIRFYWFDSSKERWCVSSWQRADHSMKMHYYKNVGSIDGMLDGIEKVGVPNSIYREYAENDALDRYVVEFSSVRGGLLEEVRAAAGEKGRENVSVSRTDAGTIQNETVALMYVLKYDGGFRCCVQIKLENGKWYNSFTYIGFDKEFKIAD